MEARAIPSQDERTNRQRPAGRPRGSRGPWVACARPGCDQLISAEAADRGVSYCGMCQLRQREIRLEATGVPLSEEDIEFLWNERYVFSIAESARFLRLPIRTLYSLIAQNRIAKGQWGNNGRLTLDRHQLLAAARTFRGTLGLKEAAQHMGVDYSYLRELVRRGVITANRTFWGHYGIAHDRLDEVKEQLHQAMPGDGQYSLTALARKLGLHHSLIQRWVKQGKLQATKGITGRVIITEADLARFVELARARRTFVAPHHRDTVLKILSEDNKTTPLRRRP